MGKVRVLGLMFLLLVFGAGSAYADSYNITTGSASFQDIGNDGNWPGDYDKLQLDPVAPFNLSGPVGTTWSNVPIELVTFTVGISCSGGPGCLNNTDGIAHLGFNINGNLFTVDVPWHVNIDVADTLTLYSISVLFDVPGSHSLLLTTDELVMGPYSPGAPYHGTLLGNFQAVPEPGTMLLLGGGLTSLPWIRRRLRK